MEFKELLKKIVHKTGFTIIRYPAHDQKRRMLAYNKFKVDTLLDVGANSGQYAGLMRELGYKGKIHSFEPTSMAFDLLRNRSKRDKSWDIHQLAIGANTGEIEINISENSFSS